MTASQLVQQAVDEGLEVIAVADHNEITNVKHAAEAGTGRLLVVPAVELSTSQGHLLCYLPDLDALQRFHAQLDLADRGTADSRCRTAILQCLHLLDQLHGFAVLAHVDASGGFEEIERGFSTHKADVLCHRALLGIEVKDASSAISYAPGDPDADRVKIGKMRVDRLGLGERQFLARVLNSDAHSLTALGRNARGDQRVTRFKMDKPSFGALRLAFEDGDARVRVEDEIPRSIPVIIGAQFDGGFLDGQAVHFSSNLNCIIGGRGTGKSTTFEAVRCLSSEPTSSDVVDSDIWPDGLHLLWQDAAGQVHTLHRPLNGRLENIDDSVFGPTAFEIDCFGQGETARISAQVTANPLALLNYLDKFARVAEALSEEKQRCDDLLQLQTRIEEAEAKVELIPQYEKALNITRQQIAVLKTAKAEEVIELQRKVAEERSVREQIIEQLDSLSESVQREGPRISAGLRKLAQPADLTVGSAEFSTILAALDGFESGVSQASSQVRLAYQALAKSTEEQLSRWKAKEAETVKEIETKRKALEAQGLRLDMAYIQKLTKDEAAHQKNVANLNAWKPHLEELRKQRAEALKHRWAARDRVATLRDAYARQASDVLDRELNNPKVSLKFVRNGYSPAAADLITATMGWRTVQVPRASLLVEQLTVPNLLQAIQKKDRRAISDLKTSDGVRVFDQADASAVIEKLAQKHVQYALERCDVHDLPKLVVTKRIEESGKVRYVPRDFGKLSLGQQQSVLLALILCSSGNHPLILDQPEDNLDGEFIYHTLVPVLRRAKERRQIVVVTHNANIAVLGDAELIVALKSGADKGMVVCRGSIDDVATRDEACKILEGAKEALQRRARTYGFRMMPL